MRIWWVAIMFLASGCLFEEAVPIQPPAPAPTVLLPDDVKQKLPKDAMGRPMLASAPLGGEGTLAISLVYDETLDDPITRWGGCLERVVACKQANPTQSIRECVPLIARCTDNAGGIACCPGSCIDAFNAAAASGMVDLDAITATFLKGDCVAGFAAFVAPVTP